MIALQSPRRGPLLLAAVLLDEHIVRPRASVAHSADHSQSITDHSNLRCGAYLTLRYSVVHGEARETEGVWVRLDNHDGEATRERYCTSPGDPDS